MRKLLMSLVLVVSMAALLLAHEEFEVIGVVTKIAPGEIEVRMQNGKLVSLGVGAQTAVLNNEKMSELAQIKKGQNVVVTGFGDNIDDLGAIEVRIVKTLPKAPVRITPKGSK